MDEGFDYRELIIKFLSKKISDNELELLRIWLEKDPANRQIFDEKNELCQKSGIKTIDDNYITDKAWLEISSQLEIGENSGNNVIVLKKSNFRVLIAAASIACMIAISSLSFWLVEKKSNKQVTVASTIINTDEGEKASILLVDSSQVILNSVSTLEYKADYNVKERSVRLAGEAFFNIRTNPERPFIVQLNNMSVSATGTRFNIFSYEDEDRIETTLEEGSLQIVINGQENLDVKAGEQVIYFTKTNKAIIRNVTTETYTSWKENKLRFIDSPFEEVLRNIARRYNVTFEVRDHDLLELKYTATFIDESIYEVMQMLKTVSPIEYEIYKLTRANDKEYLKPKIIIDSRRYKHN